MANAPSKAGQEEWLSAVSSGATPQSLFRNLTRWFYKRARMGDSKKKHFLNKQEGPMLFLADQIVKKMQRAGWPAKVQEGYRSPERQNQLRYGQNSVTNAAAYESPHQFCEAVDIVHKSMYWNAPPEFWEALATAVRQVSEQYNVKLNHGHYWRFVDSAHIEIKDWRVVKERQNRKRQGYYKPTPHELEMRFKEVLPQVL